MSGRNGQELLSTWVPAALASAFKAQARQTHGGAAALLRELVSKAVEAELPSPSGVGRGVQVSVRLKPSERAALTTAAASRHTTPANWLRSLALVHLGRQPQWNQAEVDALRELFRELRSIGTNVNQIAHAMNSAAYTGRQTVPDHVALVVQDASERLRLEMRRVVAVMTGNFDYWGLPDEDRPQPKASAVEKADLRAVSAEQVRKNRAKRKLPPVDLTS
jgi:uncharacterized protein YukE